MSPMIAKPVALNRAPESAYRIGYDLLADRRPVEALALIEPALAQAPQDRGLRSLRAWAYFIRVQLGPAEADLRDVVEADPTDVWAQHTLGRVLERQSRHAEALSHLRLAAAMSGDVDHALAAARVERQLA